MTYKVGDMVKIHKDLEDLTTDSVDVESDHLQYMGQTAKVDRIDRDGDLVLDICPDTTFWSTEWVSPVDVKANAITYETTYSSSDGHTFHEDCIDGEPVEDYRQKANLLRRHSRLFKDGKNAKG